MTDITELTSVQKNANIHRLSRLIAYASNDELHQLAVEVEQYTDQLIEALEKAQQVDEELCKLLPPGAEYMDPPDGGDVTPLEGVRRMVVDYRQRIAELESRTVKLPDLRQIVSGDRYVWSDGVFNYSQDVKAELTAKGIKWEAE
ncbi:hypothetical protein NUKP64_30390 [Klebsiella variicola]|nr:hypothetical protein NUKP64_30390 [Klebsiella variicola]SWV01330.1 phage EaA protein [Klebsiella pneumoniae]SXB13715.1 phage EaA protein [Klebsiella pneumoniae]SXU53578.1 phage EaA protein [Klebsiella pneumoniae]VUH51322.1 phage EaA protein [Klebsiella pneumoniae]